MSDILRLVLSEPHSKKSIHRENYQWREFAEQAVVEHRSDYACVPCGLQTRIPLRLVRDGAEDVRVAITLEEAEAWIRDQPKFNTLCEHLDLDENLGLDVASQLGVVVDARRGEVIDTLPSEEHFVSPDTLLPWVTGEFRRFLEERFGEAVDEEDILVACASAPHTEDGRSICLDRGRDNGFQRYRLTVRGLVLRKRAERESFQAAVAEAFAQYRGLVSAPAAGPGPLIECKLPGDLAPWTPYRRDNHPGVLAHTWSLVPPGARGLAPARLVPLASDWHPLTDRGEAAKRALAQELVVDEAAFEWTERQTAGGETQVLAKPRDATRPRTCFFGEHTGAAFKIVVRGDCVEYVCLAPARSCERINALDDDTAPTERTTRPNRAHGRSCCAVPLRDPLPYRLFTLPTDHELLADDEGCRIRDFWPSKELEKLGKPATTTVLMRGTYGSGKTRQAIAEAERMVVVKPVARIVYVSSLESTCANMTAELDKALRPHDAHVVFYKDGDAKRLAAALENGCVSVCCMSAGDVKVSEKARINLLILDELEAMLRMVGSLRSSKGDVLEHIIRLMRHSDRIRMLDADGDTACKMMARLAGRDMVIFDAPGCKPFAGRTFKVHAAFKAQGYGLSIDAQYAKAKDLAGTAMHSCIQCTSKADALLVKELLEEEEGVCVKLCTGDMSHAAKEAFVREFTGAEPPGRTVWVHTPCIGPAVSNTFCDVVVGLWRSTSQAMEDISQGFHRCRRARFFHALVLERGIVTGNLPRARYTGAVPLRDDLGAQTLAGAKGIPAVTQFVQVALLTTGLAGEVNLRDAFYAENATRCLDRFELVPPAPPCTWQQATEHMVLPRAAMHAIRAGTHHRQEARAFAGRVPSVASRVDNVGDAHLYVRAQRTLERMNRSRTILPYMLCVLERGGMSIEPPDVNIMGPADCKKVSDRIQKARLKVTVRDCVALCLGYKNLVRPLLPDEPGGQSDEFFNLAVKAMRHRGPDGDDKIRQRVDELARAPRPEEEDEAESLRGMFAVFDGDEVEEPAGEPCAEAAVRDWVHPVLALGTQVVDRVVERTVERARQLPTAGMTPKAVVRHLSAVVDNFKQLFDPKLLRHARDKRMLHLLARPLRDGDVLSKRDEHDGMRLQLLRRVNDAVSALGGGGIVGIHGRQIGYIYEHLKAIDGRCFTGPRRRLEVDRMMAIVNLRRDFEAEHKLTGMPTQVLSRAMSALCPGVYAIRPMDETKKRGELIFEISADALRDFDAFLLDPSTREFVENMVEADRVFWSRVTNGGDEDEPEAKRQKRDDDE